MRDGPAYKVRVRRTLDVLRKAKLITKDRDGHALSTAGKKLLKWGSEAAENADAN